MASTDGLLSPRSGDWGFPRTRFMRAQNSHKKSWCEEWRISVGNSFFFFLCFFLVFFHFWIGNRVFFFFFCVGVNTCRFSFWRAWDGLEISFLLFSLHVLSVNYGRNCELGLMTIHICHLCLLHIVWWNVRKFLINWKQVVTIGQKLNN